MINNLLKKFEIPLLTLAFILSGTMISIFPQISIGTILILGFINIKFEKIDTRLMIVYVIFSVIHFFTAIKDENIFLIFESIIPGFLYYGFKFINQKSKIKLIIPSILIGLIFIIIYSFITFWKPTNHPWNVDPTLAQSKIVNEILTVKPIATSDSWILKPMNLNNSGQISYSVQIRASQALRLNTFILQADNLQKRYDKYCDVQTIWTACEITASFYNTRGLYFGVGLLGSWKKGDPTLELRYADVISLQRDSFLQRISDVSRVSGLTFNENAFGATAALIGILALGLEGWSWLGILTSVFAVFAMVMSGSRGAWIGFVIGFITLLLGKTRNYKWIPVVFMMLVLLFAVLQFRILRQQIALPALNTPSNIRLLDTSDNSSIQTRIEIWRLAVKAWLETSSTILFGTGDLQNAMQSHIDARTIQAGLTKETITHAHSLWLQTLGESGLVGLFALIGLLSVVVVQAWHKRDIPAIALLCTILIINSVDYLFFFASVQFFFWMSVAGFRNSDIENFP
jgi:hypothetical protein